MPPRVVLDSNVIISAAIAGGKPDQVLDLGRAGYLTVVLSAFILNEVADVLARPKIGFSDREVAEAIAGLRPFRMVEPGKPRITLCRDASDNRVIETALAARAPFLVPGDDDLFGPWLVPTHPVRVGGAVPRHLRTTLQVGCPRMPGEGGLGPPGCVG